MSEVAPRPRGRWFLLAWGLGLPLLLGGILMGAQLAGWRAHTSLLSATALIQGLVYVAAWFAFVILAPIAALSALIDRALTRLCDPPGGDHLAETPPELGCGLEGERPGEALEG